ncbi:MAG: putative DNA binding domain-containing protein [Coriobacteriales bacterium]|jgi:ATP-dependent DNA helicase RecG|nr:putative DNA binding domain-containing protein [Coriobacteriales bacterium]
MTNEHLHKLLAEGEGLTVEFKESTSTLSNAVFETVSSFSNRYGGHILIGVKDDGTVLGVSRNAAGSMKRNFANTLNNPERMAPTLFLNLEEAEVDGRLVLYAYVPASSQIQMFSSRIYDRNEDGDMDITNSTDLIAQMSIRKSNSFTERKVFPYATSDDLLLNELMPVVRRKAVGRQAGHPWGDMSDMEILLSAGLYEKDRVTGKEGFNLAALMLFGRDEIIQQASPGYVTDCLLRVKDIDRYDDRERVDCNLIQAFDKCMAFIRKHTIDPFFLIDDLNASVRDKIAKELVSNILVHREFSSPMPGRIVIEKNRMTGENWNRSLHPGHLTPESFEPYPKNPILSRFFVNIGYADTLGSGVRNLFKFVKMYSGSEPELLESDVFKTIIPLPQLDAESVKVVSYVAVSAAQSTNTGETEIGNTTEGQGNATTNATVTQFGAAANATENQILNAVRKERAISYDELAQRLSKDRTTIYRNIRALKDRGILERVGPNKGGHWRILK